MATLSLCVICKNEEKNIGNLLESVKGELFDEVVVTDSVPEHVPVIIQNIETKIIDIISFKDLWEFIKEPIINTEKMEEIKEVNNLNVWVRYRKCRKGRSWTRIKKIIRHKYDGEILRVNTTDSLIDVTPNHSLFLTNGETVSTQNLKEGEKILVGELKNCHKTGKGHENKFFVGSENLAWLYGFFVAEGSSFYKKQKGNLVYNTKISNKDYEKLKFCSEIVKKELNVHCYITGPCSKGMYNLIINGKGIHYYFKKLFYTSKTFNRKKTNDSELHFEFQKKVPIEILNAPDNIRTKFLEGYYAGDGHIYKLGEKRWCSKSWNLAQGILWLTNSLGNSSNSVLIRDDKFNIISITTNRNKERIENFNIIKKIRKYHYSGYVYDLSTDIEKFQAGVGAIFAHNTGSKDKTLEILDSYKNSGKFKSLKIEHFEWIHDFSAARNYCFSKATSDYIQWTDADDIIKPADYQKLLDLKPKLNESPIWLCKYEYAHDEFGNSICSFYRERIVQRSLNLQWQEPIHEYIPLAASYKKTDIEIHHYKIHNSSERNIVLLEKIVEKKPNEPRNVFYLGKEYFDCGKFDQAYETLSKFVEMPGAWSENKYSALIRMSTFQKNKKDFEKAIDHACDAIRADPLKAEVYCLLGNIYMDQRQMQKAIHWYTVATNMERSEESLDIVETKYHTWLPNLQLCLIYNDLGQVVKAAAYNEIALSYRPQDSRFLSNQRIFKNSLKDKFPTTLKMTKIDEYLKPEIVEEKTKKEEIKVFDKFVGWYAPNYIDAGTIRIRVLNVQKKLKEMGYRSELYTKENEDKYDVIVAGKSYSADDLNKIIDWKNKGKKVVCDLSEDILQFMYVADILKACDLVICCSEELRKKVLSINSNTILIEDATEYLL